jgi:hypothetical protein
MNRTALHLTAALSLALVAVACAKTGDKSFRARAAQDLGCPESELFIEHKWEGDDATKRASGCGREATYVRECEHEGCLWKMQGPGAAGTDSGTGTDTDTSATSAAATDTGTGTDTAP